MRELFLKSKKAFTLAEVLITLGIIGVVAAMTIPVLQKNIEEAQFKTAYKKAFSDATNIWRSMALNNEIVPCSGMYDLLCPYNNLTELKKYMVVTKDCTATTTVNDCWDKKGEKYNNNMPSTSADDGARGFIDNSGRSWITLNGNYSNGIQLLVDTNGFKKPNKWGKDRFIFFPKNADGTIGAGIPIKLTPAPDRTAYAYDCVNGVTSPCYGTSWLYK